MSSLPAHSSSEELHHRSTSLTPHSAFRDGADSLCGLETKNKHVYLNRFLIKHHWPPQKLFFFGKSGSRYSPVERHRESVIYLQGIQICIKAQLFSLLALGRHLKENILIRFIFLFLHGCFCSLPLRSYNVHGYDIRSSSTVSSLY